MQRAEDWFSSKGWQPFPFQKEAWQAYISGKNGLVNAPTGSGKTYSLALPIMLNSPRDPDAPARLKAIWITPIKALAKEIYLAVNRESF